MRSGYLLAMRDSDDYEIGLGFMKSKGLMR
jgi:hypothetical protein